MNSTEDVSVGARRGEYERERVKVRRSRTGRAICKLMADRSEWQGTASELVKVLKRLHPNDRRLAVQTAGGLGQRLSGLGATLSNAGLVLVENERVGRRRTRMIYLTAIDPAACAVMSTPHAGADNADSVGAETAKVERALGLAIAEAMR
jgi:hypothetical protein